MEYHGVVREDEWGAKEHGRKYMVNADKKEQGFQIATSNNATSCRLKSRQMINDRFCL